jgi:hypothetical protein
VDDDADANALHFPELAGVERAGATGGPYLTPAQARDVVLNGMDCTFAAPSSRGNTCSEVDVTFFSRYQDAWSARDGDNGGVVGGWAADHEVYVVTVKGSFTIPFTGRTGGRSGRGFPRVRERTYEVDATT